MYQENIIISVDRICIQINESNSEKLIQILSLLGVTPIIEEGILKLEVQELSDCFIKRLFIVIDATVDILIRNELSFVGKILLGNLRLNLDKQIKSIFGFIFNFVVDKLFDIEREVLVSEFIPQDKI